MKKILNNIIAKQKKMLAGLVLTAAVTAMGQTAPVSISSSVDRSRITIGDVITYTITVAHAQGMEVKPPDAGSRLGAFEIRDYAVDDKKESDGTVVMEARYMISTFTTGEYNIPPVTIYYKTQQDTVFSHMATDLIKITVESMNPRTDGDIRDLKAPVDVPMTLWEKLRIPVLIAGLVLAAAAAFFLYRMRKQGKSLLPEKKEPVRPAHETAFTLLEDLKKRDLVSKGLIKEYHIELSDILRRYIAGRYFIPAPEMTTRQLIGSLVSACTVESQMQLVEDVLSQCDMVKFAKHVPAGPRCVAAFDETWTFIEETKIEDPGRDTDTEQELETTEGPEPVEQQNKTDES